MTIAWDDIEKLPGYQGAPGSLKKQVKELYYKFYMADDPDLSDADKRIQHRNFVHDGGATWEQGGGEKNLIDKALGFFGMEIPKGPTPEQQARATVELSAKDEGVPLHEYREGSEVPEQFAGRFVDAFSLGIPSAIHKTATGEPMVPDASSSGGKIAGGLGELTGFIAGLPGAATHQAGKQIASRMPQATSRLGKVGLAAGAGAGALAAGYGTRNVGEAIQEGDLAGAVRSELQAMREGAETGAIFGAAGLVPNRLARIAGGIAALETQRAVSGHAPWMDDRPISERAFDIAQDIFFLWKGGGPRRIAELERGLDKVRQDPNRAGEFVNDIRSEGEKIRAKMRNMTAEERAAYFAEMQEKWTQARPEETRNAERETRKPESERGNEPTPVKPAEEMPAEAKSNYSEIPNSSMPGPPPGPVDLSSSIRSDRDLYNRIAEEEAGPHPGEMIEQKKDFQLQGRPYGETQQRPVQMPGGFKGLPEPTAEESSSVEDAGKISRNVGEKATKKAEIPNISEEAGERPVQEKNVRDVGENPPENAEKPNISPHRKELERLADWRASNPGFKKKTHYAAARIGFQNADAVDDQIKWLQEQVKKDESAREKNERVAEPGKTVSVNPQTPTVEKAPPPEAAGSTKTAGGISGHGAKKPTKKEIALKDYREYIDGLNPEQKKNVSDLIKENPVSPSIQKRAIQKRLSKVVAKGPGRLNKVPDVKDSGAESISGDKRIGKNPYGKELYEDKNGARYTLEAGIKVSIPVGVSPKGMRIPDPVEDFKSRWRADFITEDELKGAIKDQLQRRRPIPKWVEDSKYVQEIKNELLKEEEADEPAETRQSETVEKHEPGRPEDRRSDRSPVDDVDRVHGDGEAKGNQPDVQKPRRKEPDHRDGEADSSEGRPAKRDHAEGGETPGPDRRDTESSGGPDRADRERDRAPARRRSGPDKGVGREPEHVKKELKPEDYNHVIEPDDVLAPGGAETKIQTNIKAIRLLKRLEQEGRNPTPDEKKALAQYTGWGAFSQKVFDKRFDRYLRKGEGAPPEDWFDTKALAEFKKWKDKYGAALHPGLEGMMTPEEWSRAEASTLNAHYTSKQVISAMWDVARRLGFKGGVVLEPAAGAGHFLGLMPKDIAEKSSLKAVELDTTTGGILKKLYPQAHVQVTGFEKARGIPDNSVDLVISNFPFGNFPVFDKAHPEYSNWSIHNYFFARSVDAAKPGGLVIAITSRYTLDSTKGGKYREWLANKADFIGAMRLPYTAFKGNAGTDVVTDIIVLRKKDSASSSIGEDFRLLLPQKVGGEEVNINEYYHNHPEMVLGKQALTGSMYGSNQYNVEPKKGKIEDQIREAMGNLPENIAGEGTDLSNLIQVQYAEADAKEGVLSIENGKLYTVEDGRMVEPWIPGGGKDTVSYPLRTPAKAARAKQYIKIREAAKELIARMQEETATDAEISALQEKLNTEYDAFVKKFKTINAVPFNSFLGKIDAEFPVVDALEIVHDDIVGGERVVSVEKAPIFTKRTVFPFKEPEKADSLGDAVKLSHVYKGGVDPAYIARLTGKDIEAVREEMLSKELAFEDPETGRLEPPDVYLSGNVKKKLRTAKARAEINPAYEANVKALEDVQPPDLGIEFIHFRLGSGWIPPEAVQDFMEEELGVTAEVIREVRGDATKWKVNAKGGTADARNTDTFGHPPYRAGHQLVKEMLNLTRTEITYKDEDKRTVKDEQATAAARQKQDEINARFVEWARGHKQWAEKMEASYNEVFNGYRLRKFEVPDIDRYPNASDVVTLRPHQKRAVSRAIQESTLLAYGVGTGKTFIFVTAAMEMKRIGTARKPLIVVHNSTVEQYAKSFHTLYPAAKVLVPNWQQRTAKMRKKTLAQIATGDWDAVVLPQTFFNMIANDPVREAAFIREQMDELEDAIQEMMDEEGEDSMNVKALNTLKERKMARIKEILETPNRDKHLTFEQLGVDALLIDEAHAYKKTEFFTKMNKVKGIDNKGSKRSASLMLKAQYVQGKTGGKNVVFATGTPISNTTAELWSLLRYLRPDLLKEYGIEQFDDFATAFGETVEDLEKNLAGNYVDVERFVKYVNGPELLTMFHTAADVILTKAAGLTLPAIKEGKPTPFVVPQSETLKDVYSQIKAEFERWKDLPGREKMQARHVPLVLYGKARKASIDARLVDPDNPDDPESKISHAVRRIFQIWRDTAETRRTQIVFLDKYQDSTKKFNAYNDIKGKLVDRGVPAEEVLLITDASNDTKREVMFQKIRSGKSRIIIGGTEKLGVGVDMPNKMIAAHHLDIPDRPMDVEQRNGRLVRHGNENPEVEILNYVVENSLDAVLADRNLKKQRFIDQMLSGDIHDRTFDDPFSADQENFADLMAAAAGEEGRLLKERSEASKKLRELRISRQAFQEEMSRAKRRIRELEKSIPEGEEALKQAQEDRGDFQREMPRGIEVFYVDGKPVERKELYADMQKRVEKVVKPLQKFVGKTKKVRDSIPNDDIEMEYPLIGGYRLEVAAEISVYTYDGKISEVVADSAFMYLKKGDRIIDRSLTKFNPASMTRILKGFSNKLLNRPEHIRNILEKEKKDLSEFKRNATKTFDKGEEIDDANRRIREIENELKALKEEPGEAEIEEADFVEPDEAGAYDEPGPDFSGAQQARAAAGVKLYSGIPIDEILGLLKKFKTDIPKKDITVLEEYTKIPHWMAKNREKFRKIFDVVETRGERKNQIQNSYLATLLPAWGNLSKAEVETVGNLLWRGDSMQKVLSQSGLKKLSPNVREAYLATREVLDYIWNEDRVELMKGVSDMDEAEIRDYIRETGVAAGYMPHPRKGRYYVKAEKTADSYKGAHHGNHKAIAFGKKESFKGETVWREHFDDIVETMTRGRVGWKAPAIERKVRKMFPEAIVSLGENLQPVSEDAYFSVSPEVTQELINAAMKRMEGESESEKVAFKRHLTEAVADIFKMRGFMSHGMKRADIPGFDKSNWRDAVLEYVAGWSGFKAKMLASREIWDAWPSVDWSDSPAERRYAEKYIRDAFRNEDAVDRASARMRGYLFHQFLGGTVKSAVVNLTQNSIAFIPRMTAETKWSEVKTYKEMTEAAGDVLKAFYTVAEPGLTRRQTVQKQRLDPELIRGINRARNNGIINDQWTEELMGQLPGQYGTWTREIGKAMKFMFGAAEIFNRETAYVVAFREGKRRGYSFEGAAEFAEQILKDTHFNYGKYNLPPFVRGPGAVAKFARAAYTFQTYQHQTFHLWGALATDHGWRGRFGLFKVMAALLFFGGLRSMPFIDDMVAWYQSKTGENLWSDIKDRTGKWATYIYYGMPELIGVDLSGSLGQRLPKSHTDMIGVPYEWVKRTRLMAEDLRAGDTYRAIEDFPLMPSVIRNPMQAHRYKTRGYETRGGTPIVGDDAEQMKLTGPEAAKKTLGFQPTKVSEHYRKQNARRQGKKFWQEQKDNLLDKWGRTTAIHGANSDEADAVLEEIRAFNDKAPHFMARISSRSLRGRMRGRWSKRDVLLQEAYQ